MLLNKKIKKYFCEFITSHLSLEELSEFIICIEKDSKKFLERLILRFVAIESLIITDYRVSFDLDKLFIL